MKNIIIWLKKNANLKIIDEELDVNLEIPHLAFIETRKNNSRPLLFLNPIDKEKNIKYDIPVLMNIFANKEITEKILGNHPDNIAKDIGKLLNFKPPSTFLEKIKVLPSLISLKNIFPKRLKKKGECQEIIYDKDNLTLDMFPILKTWEDDGGKFITMGQVYTQSLDGKMQNLGMYRLQQYSSNELGVHWQIHKDASHFFDEYKKAKIQMPVSIAIGGDPLYIWCGQAPMPYGFFEMLLYGFIRKKNPRLVKSITNNIYIPEDVDIVIEGFVNAEYLKVEGPFGDHTGYYTLKEPYPFMKIETITTKKKPIFHATVVGKPPLEDKYMGWATERIFLPLLKPIIPTLIDYHMPENGIFHNLILLKVGINYKGHSKQIMHALWGVGQMSFVKHIILVDSNSPKLTDYDKITEYILNRVSIEKIFISEGIIDALDHSSNESLVGGKLGVDITSNDVVKIKNSVKNIIDDITLLEKMREIDINIINLKQYFINTENTIVVVSINKKESVKNIIPKIDDLKEYIKIIIFIDDEKNDINNKYMLVWRVVNNIDAKRDIYLTPFITIDGTDKNLLDGFKREWPKDTDCTKEILNKLVEKKLIDEDMIKNL